MFSRNYHEPAWYEQIPWLYLIVLGIILIWVFKKQYENYHSHWNTLIPNFKYSPKEFYNLLEQELTQQEIPGLETLTVALSEGGMFTSRRLYLRVTWEKYQYDMCCAPFGSGMFLSWWLIYNTTNREAIISRIPFLGKWLNKTFFPTTYFQLDSAAMFMTYCHHSMLAVAEKITKESGFRINDNDRKPVLKDIFKR
tara:strand:+ start:25 stop:612 length:588 start_codon:yes stop_codon:yes gene_type:complete